MNTRKISLFIIYLLRDFLILLVLGNLLTIFFFPLKFMTIEIFVTNSLVAVMIGYPAWKGIEYIGAVLDRKLPWLRYPLKRLLVQAFSMLFFAGFVMGIGMLIWISFSEEITLRTLNPMFFKGLKAGLIFLAISLLVGNALLFFKNWRNAAIQQEELKRAHLALQYQSLKEQVKPHFLFNSFSSLVTLINTDAEKATEFVHKLSDVYRYLLEQRDNELVPVSEELKFMNDYIFLQKIRYGDNLRVNSELKAEPGRMVLPLSLQMMVENAIKHNEVSSQHPLLINIYPGEDNYIVIKNSRHNNVLPEVSLGLGLENMRKRIAFFTDKPLLTEEGGENFIVKIPSVTQ